MPKNKPCIVLNMTTLNQGGVMQRAVSFIGHLDSVLSDFDWRILASRQIVDQLQRAETSTSAPIEVFESSPAKNLKMRQAIVAKITQLKPDLLFTFAGPSYLKQPYPELMGIADGWVTHANKNAFQSVPSLKDRWGLWLASKYKLKWFGTATHFTVQTQFARDGLADRGKIDENKIHVIPNALANWYREMSTKPTVRHSDQPVRFLYFAAAYSHKRHDLIPAVCAQLKTLGLKDFQFLITIPHDNPVWLNMVAEAKKSSVNQHITNLGSLPVVDGVKLYQECHACFVPTVLETFSATYLEGMATKTPIVTSNLNFAREICGDAAEYFEAGNPSAAANALMSVVTSDEKSEQLIGLGTKRLSTFLDVAGQMELYRTTLWNVLRSFEKS